MSEKGIEESIDYNDFESDNDENQDKENDPDSFQNNLEKLYEDHKKTVNKASELQNPNRPISSYQRLMSANSKTDEQHQNSQQLTGGLNSNSIPTILSRLNAHIEKNNIKEEVMFENKEMFIDITEFAAMFKRIDFELTKHEVQLLFSENNPTLTEGYISGSFFFKQYKEALNIKKEITSFTYEEIKVNHSHSDVSHKEEKTSQVKLIDQAQSSKLSNVQEIGKFKEYQNEILSLIENQEKKDSEDRHKRMQSARILSVIPSNKRKLAPLTAVNRNTSKNAKPLLSALSRKPITNNGLSARPKTSMIAIPKKKSPVKSARQLMMETLRKKEAEEELIKLAIEKRKKEFERDCILKMTEANEICEKLRIPLSYTVYISEEVRFN